METPIQRLDFPNHRNVRLYCKREDLLPFSLGGNKVRIGQAFYADMLAKGKDCMMVYGNSRSNLCRVLANLCRADTMLYDLFQRRRGRKWNRDQQQPFDEVAGSGSDSL